MSFKLGKKSVDILHNLASIEPMMVLAEGVQQSTSNKTAKIYATATLPESFDTTFGMYNINDLLSKIRLFKEDFTIDFDESNKKITMYDDYAKAIIHTSDTSLITPPQIGQSIGEEETDIVFDLSSEDLNKISEFVKVMGTNLIAFTCGDGIIHIEGHVFDKLKENELKGYSTEPVWKIRLNDMAYDGEEFKYYTPLAFKMLDGDYEVRIRQFFGIRGQESDKLNKTRLPAIQLNGEFMRYIVTYNHYSKNQESLRNVSI